MNQDDGIGARAPSLREVKHELRTPINHIIGYSEMLLEDLEQEHGSATRAHVEEIHAIGKALENLVAAFLPTSAGPSSRVSEDALLAIRPVVLESAERLCTIARHDSIGGRRLPDLERILAAAARLRQFAVEGQIRDRTWERGRGG